MSLNDVVRKLMPEICKAEIDYKHELYKQYRVLLKKYPCADRYYLKRLALRDAEERVFGRYK